VTLTPGTHRSGITGLGGGVPEEPFRLWDARATPKDTSFQRARFGFRT